MSGDFCLDCGMTLSPESTVCSVCGFDNQIDRNKDIPVGADTLVDYYDEVSPEVHPGF
tara:strand:- start:848 stop:1021 length:174 start_codon:yes stop_codon:yes gene_type:complete